MNNMNKGRAAFNYYYHLGLIETSLIIYAIEHNKLLNNPKANDQKYLINRQWYSLLRDSIRIINE